MIAEVKCLASVQPEVTAAVRTIMHKAALVLAFVQATFPLESQPSRTAKVTAHCRSVNLRHASTSQPAGQYEAYFTTYDGKEAFPLVDFDGDVVRFSGELLPDDAQPDLFRADYLLYVNQVANSFGTTEIRFPLTDTDSNSVPDFLQMEMPGTVDFTGSTIAQFPFANTAGVSGRLTRRAGTATGTYTATISSGGQPLTYSGTTYLVYATGVIEYTPGTERTAVFKLTLGNELGVATNFTATTAYTVASPDAVVFPEVTFRDSANRAVVARPFVAYRVGVRYRAQLQLVDGGYSTSWPDYVRWQIELNDDNDADSDGIPDLSDDEGTSSSGRDWPLYRGPAGNGVSTDRIRTNWTTTPPRLLWRQALTNGLSSVTISGGRVFTQVQRSDTEYCLAISTNTGTILWTSSIGTANYPDGGVGGDDGPRSTPAVRDGRVYVLGSYLNLHCLEAATGEKLWSKDLRTLYGGGVIGWQNAASPLIEGDRLFVNLNAGSTRLAALNLADGSLAWRRHNEAMTHATPIAATLEGVRQVIFLTQNGLVSVNPADGAQLWRFTPIPYNTSIAVTPVVESNMVYYAGAYSMGSAATRVVRSGSAFTAQTLMARRSSRMIHWSTPVAHQGLIYGLYGSTSGQLRCVDPASNGDYRWQGPEFGTGATLLVDGKLLVAAENGEIVLVDPTPVEYRELTRFTATSSRIWNSPGISDGVLYVRGTTELAAYDIGAPPPPALQIVAVFQPASGRLRFTVSSVDGTSIGTSRLAAISVRESADPAVARAEWGAAPVALRLQGNVAVGEMPAPEGPGSWFYGVNEAD